MSHMAGTAALCLLLLFPVSGSQSTLHSQQEISAHQAPAAPPPPAPAPPHPRGLLQKEDTTHFNAKEACKYGTRTFVFHLTSWTWFFWSENIWLWFQQMLCQTKTAIKWACSSPPPSEPSPWWPRCTASTTSSTPSSSTCTRSLTMTQVSWLLHQKLFRNKPLSAGTDRGAWLSMSKYSCPIVPHYKVAPQQKTCQLWRKKNW